MKYLILPITLLLANLSIAATPLSPYKAEYTIEAFGLSIGKATRELRINDSQYDLKMNTASSSVFVNMNVEESSQGNIQTGQPQRYHYLRTGKNETQTLVDFDWNTMQAKSIYKNQPFILLLEQKDRKSVV